VQERLEDFRALGAQVVAVGQGTGTEAERVARQLGVEYPCLGDPDHASYRTLGFGRTGWYGLTLQPFLEKPREALRNLRKADLQASASPRSDVRRLGGALILDPAGVVRLLYRSETTTDVPANDALLACLEGLRV
jgi:hypothetical protein